MEEQLNAAKDSLKNFQSIIGDTINKINKKKTQILVLDEGPVLVDNIEDVESVEDHFVIHLKSGRLMSVHSISLKDFTMKWINALNE